MVILSILLLFARNLIDLLGRDDINVIMWLAIVFQINILETVRAEEMKINHSPSRRRNASTSSAHASSGRTVNFHRLEA